MADNKTRKLVVFVCQNNFREAFEASPGCDWCQVDVKNFDDLRPGADFVTIEIRCSDDSFRTRKNGCIYG